MKSQLTLGPCLFHWTPKEWRDFYFRVADEGDFDLVYLGEVICSKRLPNYEGYIDEVAERLTKSGKKVIRSTLALIMTQYEMDTLKNLCDRDDYEIEVNDVAAFNYLKNRSHYVGPFINIYNEDAALLMATQGAKQICLPYELSMEQIKPIAKMITEQSKARIEVQVFGRMPLALSSRCYHARAHGLRKANCQYVCEKDLNGMLVNTLDGEPFLTVNGTCTMSHSYVNLSAEINELISNSVSSFRISPQSCDMIKVGQIWRELLNGVIDSNELDYQLNQLMLEIGEETMFSNGFYHGTQGRSFLSGSVE